MHLDSTLSAVITGGASGLGAATARRLASHGVRVALFDLNEAEGVALALYLLCGVIFPIELAAEHLSEGSARSLLLRFNRFTTP